MCQVHIALATSNLVTITKSPKFCAKVFSAIYTVAIYIHYVCMPIFYYLIGRCGLETLCRKTAESFSTADYLGWLNETHCSYRADLEEKLVVT